MIRFFELGASIRIVACTLRSPTLALVYRGLIFPYLRIYLVEEFLINFYFKLILSNSTALVVKYLGKIIARSSPYTRMRAMFLVLLVTMVVVGVAS